MIAIRVLCAVLAAGGCLLPSAVPSSTSDAAMEIRTGKIVLYGPGWGDWTCPATEKCGIASKQGVKLLPGEWCVAAWYREDLNRTGLLILPGQTIRVRVCDHADPLDLPRIQARGIAGEIPWPLAETVPGMIRDGWVIGTLVLISPPMSSGGKTIGCDKLIWTRFIPR